jgi:hypothetical protein
MAGALINSAMKASLIQVATRTRQLLSLADLKNLAGA